MAIVKLPYYLGQQFSTDIMLEGSSFLEVLQELCLMYPSITSYVFIDNDKKQLSVSTAFYLNNKNINDFIIPYNELTIKEDDIIEIEPPLVGG